MPDIYAFYSPYPGAGKTTLARTIADCEGAEVISFAEPMRSMVESLFKYTDSDFYDWYKRRKEDTEPTLKTSIRHMMRTLGTEWGRNCIRENFWVDIAKNRIESTDASVVVIDDLRFQNEYVMLNNLSANFVKIIRLLVAKEPEHASDGALKNYYFDLVIENAGTPWGMYYKFKEWRDRL